MAYSQHQKDYTMQYQAEKLDLIRFRVPRGEKAALEAAAAAAGYSAVSRFIIAAINEKAGQQVLTMPRERKAAADPAQDD